VKKSREGETLRVIIEKGKDDLGPEILGGFYSQ
jgi:hypothetical protein